MEFPLHPLLIHFPIALLYGALFFHLLQMWKPGWMSRYISIWLLGLTSLVSIFTALTGDKEAEIAEGMNYSHQILELIETHETLGNLVTWISLTFFIVWVYLLLKYKSNRRIDYLALAVLVGLVTLVSFTGYFGGELVWVHGVGIN
ncbi:MAG: DUF2231 domain-containing protein [Fidelibacterota bacterium]